MGTWDRVKPFRALWPAAGSTTRPRWARPFLLIGSCGGIEVDHGQKRDPSDGNHREGLDTQRAVTEVHRRIRLIPLSSSGSRPGTALRTVTRGPGLTRQSIPKVAADWRVDARIILGFQTGHGAANGNPRTGHDKRVYAPFASVH
jgi:hypothetical protein